MKIFGQKKLSIILSLILFSSLFFRVSAAEIQPEANAFIDFARRNFENHECWKRDGYAARSIARILPEKVNAESYSNGIDGANHPLAAALSVIDRINAAFILDPTEPGNLNELLEVHKLCIGTSLEHSLVIRLFYAFLAARGSINDLQLLYRYYVMLTNREKSSLEIPLKKNLLQLKILVEVSQGEDDKRRLSKSWLEEQFPFPVDTRELIIYARCMLALEQVELAREACERIKKQRYFGNILAPYPDLDNLYKVLERPEKTVPKTRLKFEFNRIVAGLFCRKASSDKHEYWSNLLCNFEPSGNRYYSEDSSVPADIIDSIVESLQNSPIIERLPKFSSNRGFFIFLNRPESPNIALLGEMGVNYELREFYAIEGDRVRFINNPDAFGAILLFLQEAKILHFNDEGPAGRTSTFDPFKEIQEKLLIEEKDEEKELAEILEGGTFSRKELIVFWLPEIEKTFKVTQFDWKFRLGKNKYSSYYVLGFAGGNRFASNEKKRELLDLNNSALKIIKELERFSGGKVDSCTVSNYQRMIGKYYSSAADKTLVGYVAHKGLPDLYLLPAFLRLYSIMGLELPDSGPLDLPLFFSGSFRVEVEKDSSVYVSGYWFHRQEMLVIAEFSMNLGSKPGKEFARAFKLPDVGQHINFKMTDPFRYTNYGLEFDTKTPLPEGWSEPLNKVFSAEKFPYNIGRKLFFFLQKKVANAEFKIVDEPDPEF